MQSQRVVNIDKKKLAVIYNASFFYEADIRRNYLLIYRLLWYFENTQTL